MSVSRIRSVAVGFALALAGWGRLAHAAVAAATPDCDASGNSFKCELQGFLHFLYVAAGLLAIVLGVVLIATVHAYRKNKKSAEDDE